MSPVGYATRPNPSTSSPRGKEPHVLDVSDHAVASAAQWPTLRLETERFCAGSIPSF